MQLTRCLVWSFLTVALPAGCGNPAPQITVVKGEHDLGTVLEGATPRCEFEVRNDGTAPLKLGKVTSACACVDVTVEPKMLAPGESSRIAVTFLSQDRFGLNRRVLTLKCDDPAQPSVRLTLLADVTRTLDLQPGTLELGEVYQGDRGRAQLLLTDHQREGWSIVSARSPERMVEVRWHEVEVGVQQLQIELTDLAPLNWTTRAHIEVVLDHPVHERLLVPMTGAVIAPFSVEPPYDLSLGEYGDGQAAVGVLTVTNLRQSRPLSLRASIICPANRQVRGAAGEYREFVTANVREVKPGHLFEVEVMADGTLSLPALAGLVQIHSGALDQRPHSVTFSARHKGARKP